MEKSRLIYIFWTCENSSQANSIIRKLLDERLIACANIFEPITSIYRWEGKIVESLEVKVLLKTLDEHFDEISLKISQNCSYTTPEISKIKVDQAAQNFENWLLSECQKQN